ncbi:hypothetical protein JCM24511_02090 [Saitozyma sp. JCM 24511]|nr:hypothetical protein JCM24511_02090 [Saitozyma sp. JCM 24511]
MSTPTHPQKVAASAFPIAKKPYPFWLGGVAASIASAFAHPLDLTKVRLQTAGDKGMINSIRKTVANNGVRGLFDGLTGTLLRQITYSTMRFAVYDNAKAMVHTAAGSIAGGIAGILGNPAELMMVRMQADKAKPPEKRYDYRNSVQGLFRMTREEGIGSWARGFVPNGFRAILMNMSQLGSYDWFKQELMRHKVLEDGPVLHFVASLGAPFHVPAPSFCTSLTVQGSVATTVCSPADVLKSRIMTAQGPCSTSTLAVIKTSYVQRAGGAGPALRTARRRRALTSGPRLANEGPMFMFKGWLSAWTRLQPTTILMGLKGFMITLSSFVTLEQLKKGVDRYRAAGGTCRDEGYGMAA